MDKHSEQYISKVNYWLNREYDKNYEHKYVIQLLYDRIQDFFIINKLKLNYDIDDFYDFLIDYVYKYSLQK